MAELPRQPPPRASFRFRRGPVLFVMLVAIGILLPMLGSFGTAVNAAAAALIVVLAIIAAERFSRTILIRSGELAVRRHFRTRRVSLGELTELRAVKVRSGVGTRKSDFTRIELTDVSGRRLSLWPNEVADRARFVRTLIAWARSRPLSLDPETEAMLSFEAGGGLGGMFRDFARMIWQASKKPPAR